MLCRVCLSVINRDKSLRNLFKLPKDLLCINCIYNDLQLSNEILIIPHEEGKLICLIDLLINIKYDEYLYFSFLSNYFEIINKYCSSYTVIYIKELNKENFELIANMRFSNIVIVTLKLKGDILL